MSVAVHSRELAVVVEELKTDSHAGLSSAEARKRLSEHGPNELREKPRPTMLQMLLEQFKNVLILILLGATGISLFLGHGIESIVIAVIVLFAVILGFVQEYRAERAIEALRRMAAPTATVLRDGIEVKIPAKDLVPGDVIILMSDGFAERFNPAGEIFGYEQAKKMLTATAPQSPQDIILPSRTREDVPTMKGLSSAP